LDPEQHQQQTLFEKLEVEESHGPVSYCLKFFNFTKGFSNLQQTHKYLQTQQGSSIKFDQKTPHFWPRPISSPPFFVFFNIFLFLFFFFLKKN
jgi:hypothetical protein